MTKRQAFYALVALLWQTGAGAAASDQHQRVIVDQNGFSASGVPPVTGTFSSAANCGTGTSASWSASFAPLAGRNFNVSAWGTFSASLRLERSFDGTNWLPITAGGTQLYAWSAPFSESAEEDEAGVLYHLNCTAYSSGTVNYRLGQ